MVFSNPNYSDSMIIWFGLDKLSSVRVVRASKEDVGTLTMLQQALISSDTHLAAISGCGIIAGCMLLPQPGNLPVVGLISPSQECAPRAGSDLQTGQGHLPAPSMELILVQVLLFDVVGAQAHMHPVSASYPDHKVISRQILSGQITP